jgi:hypothetical protein
MRWLNLTMLGIGLASLFSDCHTSRPRAVRMGGGLVLEREGADHVVMAGTLARLQHQLFKDHTTISEAPPDHEVQVFSAPGESRERVEIADAFSRSLETESRSTGLRFCYVRPRHIARPALDAACGLVAWITATSAPTESAWPTLPFALGT